MGEGPRVGHPPALGVGGRPMRVLHFSDTFLPRRDGIITSLVTLCQGLTEAGITTAAVVPSHPAAREGGIDVIQQRSFGVGIAELRLGVWPSKAHVKRLAAWEPDIIHVHTPITVGLLGVMTALELGLPMVHTYHTDAHAYVDAYKIPAWVLRAMVGAARARLGEARPAVRSRGITARHRVMDEANQLMLGQADAVIVPTPSVLERVALPVAPDRVRIIPTGILLPEAGQSRLAEFRAEHGIVDGEPTILFVGRVNPEKGVDLLVSAFGKLLRTVPDARLLLVGAVYDQRWIGGLIKAAGAEERVSLTGQLSREDVACAYAVSSMFVFPSQTDTQGLVMHEAALAGLPVLMVDAALAADGPLAGAPYVIEPRAWPLGNAMAEVIGDRALARRLASRAMEEAARLTPKRFVADVSDVYDDVRLTHDCILQEAVRTRRHRRLRPRRA